MLPLGGGKGEQALLAAMFAAILAPLLDWTLDEVVAFVVPCHISSRVRTSSNLASLARFILAPLG
jgi:hypothetical protein